MFYYSEIFQNASETLQVYSAATGRPNDFFAILLLLGDTPSVVRIPAVAFQRRQTLSTPGLIPDVDFFLTSGYLSVRRLALERNQLTPWSRRKPLFFWRGSTTGSIDLNCSNVAQLPRVQLCRESRRIGRHLDSGLTRVVQTSSPTDYEEVLRYLKRLDLFRETCSFTDYFQYKFLIDIDGNANSWSLFPKLLSGACILKVESEWSQWYYDRLIPWKHFVPIHKSLANLEVSIEWCLLNDQECQAIAQAGQRFAMSLAFDSEMQSALTRTLTQGLFLQHGQKSDVLSSWAGDV